MHPEPAHRLRGFSLVELLVVIGIIALLIGLLVPVLSRARASAQAAACKAQLNSIGSAFQMYINDHGRYPLAPALPSVNPDGYPTLVEQLAGYVGGATGVFRCPPDQTLFPAEGISYFYNMQLGTVPFHDTLFYRIFGSASSVPVLWDGDNFHGGSLPYNWLFADGHVENFLARPD